MLYLLSILQDIIIMQLLVCYSVMICVSYMSYIYQKLDVGVHEISFHCVPNRRMFQRNMALPYGSELSGSLELKPE